MPCLLLLIPFWSVAQQGADTSFLTRAKENTVMLHHRALGVQSRLYNGSKYLAPDHTLDEHPFFASEDWVTGSVFYDGEYFEDIPLMYDLYSGALVTEHVPSGHPIQLVRTKLKQFSIGKHYFERIENESVSNSLPQSGFYEVLYAGETKVIARRQKLLREEINAQVIDRFFDERNRYFVQKNGVFFPVKNKTSLLKALSNRKTELKRYIKENRARFWPDRELLFKSVAEYYDTLK